MVARLLGRRESPSPVTSDQDQSAPDGPEGVIREHFAAINAHDLNGLLATMAKERARLYNDVRTVDKHRQTVKEAKVVNVAPATETVPFPIFADRYRSRQAFRVEYELRLVDREQRRDPTLQEGHNWAYYVLVTEGRGSPWLIADWGR